MKLRLEAERTGDDADFEGVNRGRIREEAVNHSPLDEVNGIGYIDFRSCRIYTQSIISSCLRHAFPPDLIMDCYPEQ